MDFEAQVMEIIKENKQYLNDFREYLELQGLKEKTIAGHVSNVSFYINEFLCYYEPQRIDKGCDDISEFLGDWFIRKALWSNQATVKSNAASIKKFYKCMVDKGIIDKSDYKNFCTTIRIEMPEWLAAVENYNNIDY